MSTAPDQSRFHDMYSAQAPAPWDIGRPQAAIAAAADLAKSPLIDSGLFHVFSDENRARYIAGLAHVLNKNGFPLLLCFSDAEPPGNGPRRISRDELQKAFSAGWKIESVVATHFEINPKSTELGF